VDGFLVHEAAPGVGDDTLHLEDDLIQQQHDCKGEDAEVDAPQSQRQRAYRAAIKKAAMPAKMTTTTNGSGPLRMAAM